MEKVIDDGMDAIKQLNEIGFVEFTTDLVRNVYEIIVDSSIEQLNNYAELVKDVSKSLVDYQQETTGIQFDKGIGEDNLDRLNSYITDVLELAFSNEDNTAIDPITGDKFNAIDSHFSGITVESGDDQKSFTKTVEESGVIPKENISLDPNVVRSFIFEKLNRTSSESYNMLITILKLGMQKVVVTDGQIKTALTFNVSSAKTNDKSSREIDAKSSAWSVSGSAGYRAGGFRASVSGGYGGSKINVKVVNEKSSSAVNMNANIVGSVTINFRTESFPTYEN